MAGLETEPMSPKSHCSTLTIGPSLLELKFSIHEAIHWKNALSSERIFPLLQPLVTIAILLGEKRFWWAPATTQVCGGMWKAGQSGAQRGVKTNKTQAAQQFALTGSWGHGQPPFSPTPRTSPDYSHSLRTWILYSCTLWDCSTPQACREALVLCIRMCGRNRKRSQGRKRVQDRSSVSITIPVRCWDSPAICVFGPLASGELLQIHTTVIQIRIWLIVFKGALHRKRRKAWDM